MRKISLATYGRWVAGLTVCGACKSEVPVALCEDYLDVMTKDFAHQPHVTPMPFPCPECYALATWEVVEVEDDANRPRPMAEVVPPFSTEGSA